jgi:hypothetical protein
MAPFCMDRRWIINRENLLRLMNGYIRECASQRSAEKKRKKIIGMPLIVFIGKRRAFSLSNLWTSMRIKKNKRFLNYQRRETTTLITYFLAQTPDVDIVEVLPIERSLFLVG